MANWDLRQGPLYTDIRAMDQYETDSGNFVIPLALTDEQVVAGVSPVAVVKAYASYQRRIVHHRATKNGSPPMAIKQESVGAFTFLGATLTYPQPTQDTSLSNYDWTCFGQYEYVVSARSLPEDGFVLTGQPFTTSLRKEVQETFGSPGQIAALGAVAQAGPEAKLGYTLASSVDLSKANYTWPIISYVPAVFFNAEMINGYAPYLDFGGGGDF